MEAHEVRENYLTTSLKKNVDVTVRRVRRTRRAGETGVRSRAFVISFIQGTNNIMADKGKVSSTAISAQRVEHPLMRVDVTLTR